LADKLKRLSLDGILRAKLIARGVENVKRFSLNKYLLNLREIYQVW